MLLNIQKCDKKQGRDMEIQLFMQYNVREVQLFLLFMMPGCLHLQLTFIFVTVVSTVIRSITLKADRNALTIGTGKL